MSREWGWQTHTHSSLPASTHSQPSLAFPEKKTQQECPTFCQQQAQAAADRCIKGLFFSFPTPASTIYLFVPPSLCFQQDARPPPKKFPAEFQQHLSPPTRKSRLFEGVLLHIFRGFVSIFLLRGFCMQGTRWLCSPAYTAGRRLHPEKQIYTYITTVLLAHKRPQEACR